MPIFMSPATRRQISVLTAARESKRYDPHFVSIKEFAAMIGRSVRQVRRINQGGECPARMWSGHQHGYRRDAVAAWLAARNKPAE